MSTPDTVIDLTADSPPFSSRSNHHVPRDGLRPTSAGNGTRRPSNANTDEDVAVVGVSLGPSRSAPLQQTDFDPVLMEVSGNQRITEGVPYTHRNGGQPPSNRADLAEQIGMLASRFVARSSAQSTSPQTLLRPYAHALSSNAQEIRSRPSLTKGFDPKWTHPLPPNEGFSQSIIEPAVDVEAVAAGDQDAVVPLPNTTPICALCEYALVLNGSGDDRIFALPCGHVIDARCVKRLSTARTGRSHQFTCPVENCRQRVHPERGHANSCIEMYI